MTVKDFVAIPYFYDDADLDVYQFRMLVHIRRTGVCLESTRSLAKNCVMSKGKASETRKWLLDQGWIETV